MIWHASLPIVSASSRERGKERDAKEKKQAGTISYDLLALENSQTGPYREIIDVRAILVDQNYTRCAKRDTRTPTHTHIYLRYISSLKMREMKE